MSTKYCINCKHFSPAENDLEHEFARCSQSHSPSLITGRYERKGMMYCIVARASTSKGTCGADGNHYEEKAVSHV
jgi:hypothetical protein